jgi:hypothetical protein
MMDPLFEPVVDTDVTSFLVNREEERLRGVTRSRSR